MIQYDEDYYRSLKDKYARLEGERLNITKRMKEINTDTYKENKLNESEYDKLKKELYSLDLEIMSIKSILSEKYPED